MARRLGALALALVIVGVPVAATVCQVTCTSHDMSEMAQHDHLHSCSASPTVAGQVMNAVPHACGHLPDDAFAVRQTLELLTAPALVVSVAFSFAPPVEVGIVGPSIDVEQRPPGRFALTAQLRV